MINKTFRLLLWVSLMGFLGLTSCVEEFDMTDESVTSVTPKEIITTSLYGTVMDESDAPMVNAEVELQTVEGTQSTTTDEYGQFEFFDVRVKGPSAFVKVSAPGKFDGFRRANVIKNSLNYTEIKMLDYQIVGTINANEGGSVSTTSGAEVRLPADAVVNQNGQAYNGIISVAMQWIDPTAEDLYQRIVGDLSGIDIEGNEVVLGTFGMMAVELLDNQGNELQIAEGSNAALTWPVPSERLSDAPQTIPVWSYDENLGTWIEEEIAVQDGNTFVGDVSHFSYWNLDWKGPNITLTGQVTYNGSTGNILSTFRVTVHSPLFGERGGFINADGNFQFYRFPANEVFDLKIRNICGNVVYQQTYGPYSQDTDLGTIDVMSNSVQEVLVSGVAVDCDNNPIEDAFVQLVVDSSSYYTGTTAADGSFEFLLPYCGTTTTAEVFIFDPATNLVSAPQSVDITSTNPVDLGNIRVCDQAAVFFQLSVDTFDLYYTPPTSYPFIFDNPQTGYTLIGVEGSPNGGFIQISSDMIIAGTGSYSSTNHFFSIGDRNNFYTYMPNDPADLDIEITEYSDVPGEHVGGNFTGTVSPDSTGQGMPVNISGAFRIEIQ